MNRICALLVCILFSASAHAGAWGEGSFENDASLDWVSECTRSAGAKLVSATLNAALKAEYLEAPEGSAAVAAAEVVAAARGKPSPDFPKELTVWLERQPKAQLAGLAVLARKALRKVREPKSSELKQLGSESAKNRWDTRIAELAARVGD
jgi:hypothetical protein